MTIQSNNWRSIMKGIVYTKYGPPEVLQLQEVEKPTPKDNEVLVKVQAASINALDFRRFESESILGRLMDDVLIKAINKVLGADIAGRVESGAAAVKQFQPGDEVYGVAVGSVGGFVEYACATLNHLALKPASLSFE